jgi:hypothetical protein
MCARFIPLLMPRGGKSPRRTARAQDARTEALARRLAALSGPPVPSGHPRRLVQLRLARLDLFGHRRQVLVQSTRLLSQRRRQRSQLFKRHPPELLAALLRHHQQSTRLPAAVRGPALAAPAGRPSALLDTRVIYCADCLELTLLLPRRSPYRGVRRSACARPSCDRWHSPVSVVRPRQCPPTGAGNGESGPCRSRTKNLMYPPRASW